MSAFRQLLAEFQDLEFKRCDQPTEILSHFSINDVVNVVICPAATTSMRTHQCDPVCEQNDENNLPFQRCGVTEDGIGLAFDCAEGILQIVVRYRKLIVTTATIECLGIVGVRASSSLLDLEARTTVANATTLNDQQEWRPCFCFHSVAILPVAAISLMKKAKNNFPGV